MIPKIAIVGPESTGKSTLANALADHFNTNAVQEYAREYIDQLSRDYLQRDLLEIAAGQLKKEKEALQKSAQVLVCDTNLLVIKIWSEFKYGYCDPALLQMMNLDSFVHYFLTDIDIPWTFDPQREHPHKRAELFDIYQKELETQNLPFTILSGTPANRLKMAISKINEIILAK